jgi:two-component system sensor histidine kinase BarA
MPAIDWHTSLELSNNKSELAQAILAMYMEKLPIAKNNIITNRNNYQKLQDHVHKLLGASCYCGVPKIKATATEIETALKLKQTKKIPALLDKLMANIDETIDIYQKGTYC